MKIEKIQQYITPKSTGYSATAGLCLTVTSGMSKNKTIRKTHKPFAWITAGLTALHIGLIEYYNYKFRGKGVKEKGKYRK